MGGLVIEIRAQGQEVVAGVWRKSDRFVGKNAERRALFSTYISFQMGTQLCFNALKPLPRRPSSMRKLLTFAPTKILKLRPLFRASRKSNSSLSEVPSLHPEKNRPSPRQYYPSLHLQEKRPSLSDHHTCLHHQRNRPSPTEHYPSPHHRV